MPTALRHRCAGEEGPPVVLVHGAGGSSRVWLRVLTALAARARVYAVDLPGHGRSDGPAPASLPEHREALRAFVSGLALSARPFLVGHSMGGAIVLDYA